MKTIYPRLLPVSCLTSLIVLAVTFSSNATKHIVTVQNFSFTPSSITINLGDTMEWQWVNGTHTTTSDDGKWDSPINSATTVFDYVPPAAGVYNYHCDIHPLNMTASFTVACPSVSVSIS